MPVRPRGVITNITNNFWLQYRDQGIGEIDIFHLNLFFFNFHIWNAFHCQDCCVHYMNIYAGIYHFILNWAACNTVISIMLTSSAPFVCWKNITAMQVNNAYDLRLSHAHKPFDCGTYTLYRDGDIYAFSWMMGALVVHVIHFNQHPFQDFSSLTKSVCTFRTILHSNNWVCVWTRFQMKWKTPLKQLNGNRKQSYALGFICIKMKYNISIVHS